MIKMFFVLLFSLGIAILTITELPIVLIVFGFFVSIVCYVVKRCFLIGVTAFACVLALLSWQFYQRRYSPSTSQTRQIGTGIINDTISSGKYLFTNKEGDFLLYSKKSYIPGNQLRFVGRNVLMPTHLSTIKSIGWQTIFYSGFNQQKRSKMKGYANIVYETNSVLINSGSLQGLAKLRYFLRQKLEHTYTKNKTAGLVLGMLIGDKSLFEKTDYQLFIDSGLVHLVAVSGGNIVMLVTFLTALLFFLPFYVRIFIILLVVVSYGMVCGLDSSVLRAVLMGSLSLAALLVGRPSSLRRLLALVHIVMLMYNPYFLVYDVGYLLSFSAVLGILFIDIFRVNAPKELPMYVKPIYRLRSNYLKPSLGATLGIFPIIIFFMGKINIGGVVGNMFVLPLVPLVMIGGFIGGFLPSVLQKYYIPIVDAFVKWIYNVATRIDQYGIIIVADQSWVKFLIFGTSLIMMIVVTRTLTTQEVVTTQDDEPSKDLDISKGSVYDAVRGIGGVETSKKIQ